MKNTIELKNPIFSKPEHATLKYDPRDLQPFLEAAKQGNFSAAARHLNVTPSAVSKSVARLEESLGTRLFNRSTRQLELTVEGLGFFDRLSVAMENIEAAVEALDESRKVPSGPLRVSLLVSFGKHFVLPLIPAFQER